MDCLLSRLLGEGECNKTMELLKDWDYLEKQVKSKLSIKRKKKPRYRGTNPRAKGTNKRAMSKKKGKTKAIVLGKGDKPCPHCGGELIIRAHKEITKKLRNQSWYFTQWEYCYPCGHTFTNPQYEVVNPKGVELKERQQQESFFKSI